MGTKGQVPNNGMQAANIMANNQQLGANIPNLNGLGNLGMPGGLGLNL